MDRETYKYELHIYWNVHDKHAILGGWKNTLNVIARINEHGDDRKEYKLAAGAEEERLRPVAPGQVAGARAAADRADRAGGAVPGAVRALDHPVAAHQQRAAGAGDLTGVVEAGRLAHEAT